MSTITATLPEQASATELLRACFPGGSITGAPKVRAMEIIEELEPQRRNAYCGSIGYLSACGTMDTNITIRTLVTENGRIHCSAGGGIVADSRSRRNTVRPSTRLAVFCRSLGVRSVVIPSNSPASLHAFISRFQLQLPQAAQISHNVRPAAVLIPIVCRAEPTLLLTRRADSLRKHAGVWPSPAVKPTPKMGPRSLQHCAKRRKK